MSTRRARWRWAEKIERAFGGVEARPSLCSASPSSPTPTTCATPPASSSCRISRRRGATIRAYDPEGAAEARKLLNIELRKSAYEALDGADGVVILTEWNEFRALDFARMKSLLKRPLMVDLRNIYRPSQMAAAGFTYVSVGARDGGRLRGRRVATLPLATPSRLAALAPQGDAPTSKSCPFQACHPEVAAAGGPRRMTPKNDLTSARAA